MHEASQLPGRSPLMWKMLLHLHVNLNADDDNFLLILVYHISVFVYSVTSLWRAKSWWPLYLMQPVQVPKSPKFSDTQNVCYNHAKIQTKMSFHRAICPKGADGMANSVDFPLGAV